MVSYRGQRNTGRWQSVIIVTVAVSLLFVAGVGVGVSVVLLAKSANETTTTTPIGGLSPTPTTTRGPTAPIPSITLANNTCKYDYDKKRICEKKDGYWCLRDGALLCKPEPDAWLVWLRRVDGSVDFDRLFDDFLSGFGDPAANYWLGLETLHLLTSSATRFKLRVELEYWEEPCYIMTPEQKEQIWPKHFTEWAEYGIFNIGGKSTKYKLTVGEFSGDTQVDALKQHSGYYFSTRDIDRDTNNANCADTSGPWWHGDCFTFTMPTGKYGDCRNFGSDYLHWYQAFDFFDVTKKYRKALKSMTMKIAVA